MHSDISDEVIIRADAEMIKIVLRNLISNAIKYCNTNDHIYVRATAEKEMTRISVEDTGVGISKKNRGALFDLSHLSVSGTDHEIGAGLGLTLCKEFIETMGGHISVTSTEGTGTCFEFTIPCFKKDKASTKSAIDHFM